jgi:hypothetical protein
MFREHAPVLPFRSQRAAPRRTAAFNNSHSNDNRLGFRRPADQRRRAKPVLVCHWIEVGGRLECHWEVATDGAASQSERPRLTGSAFEPPLGPCVNGAQFARTAFDPRHPKRRRHRPRERRTYIRHRGARPGAVCGHRRHAATAQRGATGHQHHSLPRWPTLMPPAVNSRGCMT